MKDRRLSRIKVGSIFALFGLLLAVAGTAIAGPSTAWHLAPGSTALVNEAGEPWLLLDSAVPVAASKTGSDALRDAVPRSLAPADLDGNGVPDLVAGYATTDGGILLVYRGDVSRYPAADGQAPLLAPQPATTVLAPDWVVAGDFDADGRQDLVVASRDHAALLFLAGDGGGGLADGVLLPLPGTVTTLATGEVNRRDALADLAVAVVGDGFATLLVFESPGGALAADPESFPAATAVTDLAFGELDGEMGRDLAAAAGRELLVVRGRDRHLSWPAERRRSVPRARVARLPLESPATAVELAQFTGSQNRQLAILQANGEIAIVAFDATFGLGEVARVAVDHELGPAPLFVSGRVSSRAHSDLVVGSADGSLRMVNLGGRRDRQTSHHKAQEVVGGSLAEAGRVAAVLPLRLNIDALDDLVVLPRHGGAAQVLLTAPMYTYTVNSSNDVNDGSCNATHCSLREAINATNSGEAADLIVFDIGGQAIKPTSELPTVIMPVTIDGRQGGACPTYCYPTDLDGSLCGGIACDGLAISAGSSAVTRMVVHGFSGDGLRVTGGSNVVVELSRFGLDFDGNPDGNDDDGISVISGASNITIGGAVTAGNVISANGDSGVSVTGTSGSSTTAVEVSGNLIGTGSDGTTAAGNNGAAVVFGSYTEGCDLGSTTARNVIADSTSVSTSGVWISSATAHDLLVVNNLIGLGADGSSALGNRMGIDAPYARNVSIGGTTSAHRNVISNSLSYGMWLHDTAATGLTIQGNYVGTDATGNLAAPNLSAGRAAIVVEASDDVLIGGAVSGAGNLISGNAGNGILIWPNGALDHAERCSVLGNWIGVNAVGSGALPNGNDGVGIIGPDNVIGSSTSDGNTISGNLGNGIRLTCNGASDCDGNSIEGNRIGVAATSASAIGNGEDGIQIYNNLGDTQIGGSSTGEFNIIANNGGAGVLVYGPSGSNGHRIQKNFISDNAGLGIDLGDSDGADGVTANDAGDLDTGPNGWQNHPVITGWNSSTLVLSFQLDSTPNSTFVVEFFATEACDASGHGEGEAVLPSTTISTDATGLGSKSIYSTALPASWSITARATDLSGNTSEFSPCVPAAGYTTPLIFADGFEMASTLRWSASVP